MYMLDHFAGPMTAPSRGAWAFLDSAVDRVQMGTSLRKLSHHGPVVLYRRQLKVRAFTILQESHLRALRLHCLTLFETPVVPAKTGLHDSNRLSISSIYMPRLAHAVHKDSQDSQAFKTTILAFTMDGLSDLNLFVTRSDRALDDAQHHPVRLAWTFYGVSQPRR